jgi:hypothetical protein
VVDGRSASAAAVSTDAWRHYLGTRKERQSGRWTGLLKQKERERERKRERERERE